MSNWLLNRTLRAGITLYVVITFSFLIVRLLPGGPMDYLRAQLTQQSSGMTQEEINNIVESYMNVQPDQPLLVQYVDYMSAVAQGDLGTSTLYQEPVNQILIEAAPWTIFLMTVALAMMAILGIVLGALMAYDEGGRLDVSATVGSILLNSIPFYVAAIFFQYIIGYQLGWLPTTGRIGTAVPKELGVPFVVSALKHAALPVISLVMTGFGSWALKMRGNSISVLGEDYLRVARLRGLSRTRIALVYVARNAILPLYTGLLITIGFMFGGSIILEQIFAYHGIGYFMFQAINARDYPLMLGSFMIITAAVVVGVYVADLTYGMIDPRVGKQGES